MKKRSKPIPIGHADGRPVSLSPDRRDTHMHVIGASGQGKSKFLEHCIREDIKAGHGVCLIDPEGDLYENIVAWCAANNVEKIRKIHLFDPTEKGWRFRFNPLYLHEGEKRRHRVDNVIEALAQVWGGEDSRSTPAIRTTLRAVFTALVASGYSMAEAFYLTSTKDPDQIIRYLADQVDNPVMSDLWHGYHDAPDREHMIEFGGARRRFVELLEDEEIREILASYDDAIDFKSIMDNGEIVLVNLSPEAMGDDPARAFGAMLVREMFYCASRRHPPDARTKPFYAYIDECAEFLTKDITRILARSRKRGLHVILAHQWLEQLREQGDAIYHGVMSIQNKVVFGGLSDEDATILADQLFRSEYDLETPIESLIKPGVAAYRRTWFSNWSDASSRSQSYSSSESESEGSGETSNEGMTAGVGSSQSVSQIYDEDGWPTGTYTVSIGDNSMTVDSKGVSLAESSGSSSTESYSESSSESSSRGASEGLEPILKDFVGSVHSLDNVRHMAISRLRTIPPRNAVVKAFNTPTFDVATYGIKDPNVSLEWVDRFKQHCFSSSPYTIEAERARELMAEQEKVLYIEAYDHFPIPKRSPGGANREIDPEDDTGMG